MLTIKLFGDKQGSQFTWSIMVMDSRGAHLSTDGIDASEKDAKASMLTALGALVEKLVFKPIDEGD